MTFDVDTERRVMAGIIVVAVVCAVVATVYLWHVYRGVPGGFRSRLYGAVAVSATLVTAGAALVLVPALRAVLDVPRLADELNLVLVGTGLVLALAMPTYMAEYVRRVRSQRKARAQALWKEREE